MNGKAPLPTPVFNDSPPLSRKEDANSPKLPEILMREIAKREKAANVKRSRSPYKCKLCGKPKRGHVCEKSEASPIASSLPGPLSPFKTTFSYNPLTKKHEKNEVILNTFTTPNNEGFTPPNMIDKSDELDITTTNPFLDDTSDPPIVFSMALFDIAISAVDLLRTNLQFHFERNPSLSELQNLKELMTYIDEEERYLENVKTSFEVAMDTKTNIILQNKNVGKFYNSSLQSL